MFSILSGLQEADSEVDRLSDPEASNKLSLNSSSTHDISDDLLNPQKVSLYQVSGTSVIQAKQ